MGMCVAASVATVIARAIAMTTCICVPTFVGICMSMVVAGFVTSAVVVGIADRYKHNALATAIGYSYS